MKTLITTPLFGTPCADQPLEQKIPMLYEVCASHFGLRTEGNPEQAAPRILALCRTACPNLRPDIALRYAVSILYRLHPSESFNNPDARQNMHFANDALDLTLGNLKPRIEEIMRDCKEECNSPSWSLNMCVLIEKLWQTEGYADARMVITDYGNGYRIDATGIAIDLAREQEAAHADCGSAATCALNRLTEAVSSLLLEEGADFVGDVSDQIRAWCRSTIGLKTPAYTHLVRNIVAALPGIIIRE